MNLANVFEDWVKAQPAGRIGTGIHGKTWEEFFTAKPPREDEGFMLCFSDFNPWRSWLFNYALFRIM